MNLLEIYQFSRFDRFSQKKNERKGVKVAFLIPPKVIVPLKFLTRAERLPPCKPSGFAFQSMR